MKRKHTACAVVALLAIGFLASPCWGARDSASFGDKLNAFLGDSSRNGGKGSLGNSKIREDDRYTGGKELEPRKKATGEKERDEKTLEELERFSAFDFEKAIEELLKDPVFQLNPLVEATIAKLMFVESTSIPAMLDKDGKFVEAKINYHTRHRSSGATGFAQIMPSNIPRWTQEALGYSMSPDDFWRDPEAQMKTTRYMIGKMLREAQQTWPTAAHIPSHMRVSYGDNIQQFWSDAAISEWFTGKKTSFIRNRGISDGGTTMAGYLRKAHIAFNKYYPGMQRLAEQRGYWSVY